MNSANDFSFSSLLDTSSSYFTQIDGVADSDIPVFNALFTVWRDKYPGNLLRTAFYDGKQRFKNLNISVPEELARRIGNVVGWPQKAVRALADKSTFEGFEFTGADSLGIESVVLDNDLQQTVSEAIISAYKHSCSFLTVDMDVEDPTGSRVLIVPRAADWSAALWDYSARRVKAALTITSNDKYGRITGFNVWLHGYNYECSRADTMRWRAVRQDNRLNRVAVVPLVYDRQMDKPFGRSRINSNLMHLTDMAVRTTVRMEATAEFYSVPKLWFLGLDKSAMSVDTWSSLISKINAVSRDEDGDVPEMKQLQQATMTPHAQMLETLAMLASAETDIPPENLGIRLSNPTSAEALAAAEQALTRVADRQNVLFGAQLMKALSMAIQLRDNTREPPDLSMIRPVWAPTRVVSEGAKADYYAKVAGANPAWADSDTGLAKLGLSMEELRSFRAYQREQQAKADIEKLRANLNQSNQQEQTDQAVQAESGEQVTETINVNKTPVSGGGE